MHKKIALGALAFALIIPAGIAFANEDQQELPRAKEIEMRRKQAEIKVGIETENPTEIQKNKAQEIKGKRFEFQDRKEKMEAAQCKKIESKINTQFKRYENKGKMLRNVYGNMQKRLIRLVERLDTAGADTTKIKADLVILNEKISKLYADHGNLLITLQSSQTFVCDGTEAEFKGRLENARKMPEIIKEGREDIKNFFQTTIKPDLQAIRVTLADQKTEIEKPEEIKEPKKAATEPETAPIPAPEVTPTPVQ